MNVFSQIFHQRKKNHKKYIPLVDLNSIHVNKTKVKNIKRRI